jgi:plastocyanin
MAQRRFRAVVAILAVLAATVLVAAPARAGGGCHRPPSEGRGGTLALTELCFRPTVLRVAPGSEVTIVNRDPIAHPLSRPGGGWGWDGAEGDQTTVRLERSGIYPFFCYAHPGMVGVVVVGDGRGTGDAVVDVANPAAPAAVADAARPAAGSPADAGPAGRQGATSPTGWLVLVALAALVGAAAGARLTAARRQEAADRR